MHVFRGILDHSLPHVVVLYTVDGDGLESPPAHGQDERVSCLEDTFVPAVLLDTDLDIAQSFLSG